MPGRAMSIAARAAEQRTRRNTEISSALQMYDEEQEKPEGVKKLSIRAIAELFPLVHYSTLNRLVKPGARTIDTFNSTKQALSSAEEEILVEFILESADRACPPSHAELRRCANEILASHAITPEDIRTVGKNWLDRFLTRHRDKLQTHWSKPLDTIRARALNPGIVDHWFVEIVQKRFVGGGFLPKNTYASDETGCPAQATGSLRVVGKRGTKLQHRQGTANRENVTVLVTICADGTALSPMIIFKAKNFRQSWRNNNVAHASFAHSPKGWTDGEIAASWLVDDFDVQTRDKAAGQPRALFLDGHSSHYTKKVLDFARSRNITIFGYPPHCTHALQGLDVACFGRLKEIFAQRVAAFEEDNGRGVDKSDFAQVFGTAFLEVFTEQTIKSAFAKTGIHPFNPDVIKPAQMKPSAPTSIRSSFPLPVPPTVQAVLQAIQDQPATAFELDPATYEAQPSGPSFHFPEPVAGPSSSGSGRRENQHGENVQETEDHTPIDSDSAPNSVSQCKDAETSAFESAPQSRRRMVIAGLVTAPGGAILVNNETISSAYPVVQPILETLIPTSSVTKRNVPELPDTLEEAHAMIRAQHEELVKQDGLLQEQRDGLERQNATMIVHGLHLNKTNRALRGKENHKVADKTRLNPEGRGTVLTDDAFYEVICERDKKKAQEEEAKKAKGRKALEKKKAKSALEAQWKVEVAEWKNAREAWTEECATLRRQGILVKNLPKPPRRPRKPKMPKVSFPEDVDEYEESEPEEEVDEEEWEDDNNSTSDDE